MTFKTRGFELVEKYKNLDFLLPSRATNHSAGYDLKAAEEITIEPDEIKLVPLGVKAYMLEDEQLLIYDRSSNPKKKGIILINSVGVIDSDYYNNKDNEGLIFGQFKNITEDSVTIPFGERVAQGVFSKFLTIDNEDISQMKIREGGFGSTK